MNALKLNLEELERRLPDDEEHMLWSMSMGLDTVMHSMFSEEDRERRVRRAIGDDTRSVLLVDYYIRKRTELRLQVVKRICFCLGITETYVNTHISNDLSGESMLTSLSSKLSLLADIYGRLIVPSHPNRNESVQGVLSQVRAAVGYRRTLALKVVSLSGHTLNWFEFKDDNEFVLVAGETASHYAVGAIARLKKMFNEYEEGLAAEEGIENPPGLVPSGGLTNLSHIKEPTNFQTLQDETRKLFEDTAMLYANIYPDNEECQNLYNTMLEALYRPGSTGFLKDKQEFVAGFMSPGSPQSKS